MTDIKFSGDYNPVEYLLKILGNEKANEDYSGTNITQGQVSHALIEKNLTIFMDKYGNDLEVKNSDAGVLENYSSGFMAQFCQLFIRNIQMTLRDGKTLGALFGQSIFIALFGGALFYRLSNDYINPLAVNVPFNPELPLMRLDQTNYMNRVGA